MLTQLTNQDVMFVGGLPRTGGSMLPFMFDGMPGVYTPPFEMHIAGATGDDVRDEDLRNQEPSRVVAITSRLKVQGKEQHPPKPIACKGRMEFTFDSELFYDEYVAAVRRGEVNEKNYVAQKIAAFFSSIDRPLAEDTRCLIAHSGKAIAHSSAHFLATNEIGLYVYTRRDDIAWWRSYTGKFANVPILRDRKVIEQFIEVKQESDDLATEYERRLGDRYVIVEYEHSVDSPTNTVADLCGRLGLSVPPDHDPKPTFLGIPVPANSSFGELRQQTDIIPASTARPDFDAATTEFLEELRSSGPGRLPGLSDLSDRAFGKVARYVHRRFYVLELFRKQLSKAGRVLRLAQREKKMWKKARAEARAQAKAEARAKG